MMGVRVPAIFLLLLFAAWPGTADSASLRLYVAPNGNDAWSGRLAEPNADKSDGPFATLEKAREAVRKALTETPSSPGGIEVILRGGTYALDAPFELTEQDSGGPESPVVYAASSGEEVRLLGGKVVTDFAPVSDPAVRGRLDEGAREQVWQADLKALGVSDFGPVDGGGLELFFDGRPMTLARWPNEGFVKIVDLVVQDGHQIHGIPGSQVGRFVYEGDRPQRWLGEKDPWLHGYWFWDWSDQRQPIASIDVEKREIALKEPYHNYGYRKGQWYYAFNMLCELDAPGEWYLDREAGMLYFWPPEPLEGKEVFVSVLPTLVTMEGVSHVTLRKLILEGARGTALRMHDGAGNRIVGCTLRNIGGDAIGVSGGTNHGVIGCDLYRLGGGGITLVGGDRTTLTPGGHFADNNHIHHYARWYRMYHTAVSLQGVGNRASHNLIHDAPHMAIGFGGNDHVIEFNEIHHVCEESNDAGAMYAGRDWTMRGTVVRYNYLYEIVGFEDRGCVGVYLDDMYCGTKIYGNVFKNVTRAAFIGGGRDNAVVNNLFIDCKPALHVDARATNWAHYHADEWVKEGTEKGTVSGTRHDQPPYSSRYPELVRLLADEPHAPKGNVVARNVCWGGVWDEIEESARPLLTMEDNLVGEDPKLVDAAGGDYRFQPDSPAHAIGFEPIPFERIGLYEDESRASWPVEDK